jgi:hypothetical protein
MFVTLRQKLDAQAARLAAQAAQLKEQDAALAEFRAKIPQLTFRSRIDVTGTNCLWKHEAVNVSAGWSVEANRVGKHVAQVKEGSAERPCAVPMAVPVHSRSSQADLTCAHAIPTARPVTKY